MCNSRQTVGYVETNGRKVKHSFATSDWYSIACHCHDAISRLCIAHEEQGQYSDVHLLCFTHPLPCSENNFFHRNQRRGVQDPLKKYLYLHSHCTFLYITVHLVDIRGIAGVYCRVFVQGSRYQIRLRSLSRGVQSNSSGRGGEVNERDVRGQRG